MERFLAVLAGFAVMVFLVITGDAPHTPLRFGLEVIGLSVGILAVLLEGMRLLQTWHKPPD